MALTEGSVLGERFEVRGVLGRGGMATVYLAHDRVRNQRIALKVLHPHLADDPGSARRLKREIQAANLVRHEAALVAHELHELDGVQVLTLPFFPGETLAEHVAAGSTLSEPELRALATRVGEVLAQAHRVGVLHRDVTPNNVMIDSTGRSVLTDFGLARVGEGGTKSTTALGTVGYAAPEVYAGDRGDPRSDLYSLGAVLYFAATGKEPFASPTAMGALQKQMSGEITPLSELRPDLSEDFVRTVEALLHPDPNLRPQGASDVVGAVSRHRAPERSTGPLPRAPEATSAKGSPGTALQRALPSGHWAVVVKDGDNEARRKVVRVEIGRDGKTVESMAFRSLLTLWDGLKEVLGVSDVPVEQQLAAAVARVASLPPEALDLPNAMYESEFRLVDGVSEATAKRLAKEAKALGFRARAREARPALTGWAAEAAKMRNPLIAMVWGLYIAASVAGFAGGEVLGAAIVTTLLLAFLHDQGDPAWRALPLAYGDDLNEHAAEGYEHVVTAEDHELTRGEELTRRAEVRLEALSVAIDRAEHLPDPAVRDLRHLVISLAEQARVLGAEVDRLEAELADHAEPTQEAGWLASRLQRLRTLQAEGESVDPSEIARLEQALAADAEAFEARGRVESALTAAVAQLLEIAAIASRTRLDLAARIDDARAPELVASLKRDAEALDRARREVQRGRVVQ
ncbi:MAG: hypothetical protein EP330_30890 [Deltaproteobacteria bacterium]|nr:MAG: hypothetical protein EP330_30890 [Deltaproteobacteria bacterium]